MGDAYVAKAAAAADVCASGPAGWDPFWLFPGPPWAPGWPIGIPSGYSLNLTLGAVSVGAAVNLVASVLFNSLDDSNLQCHALQITALINGSTLQVSNDGITYSNSLTSSVKNYSGTSYGFNKNLYLNLTNANIGQSGSITVTNVSTNPTFSATVNFTVVGNFSQVAVSIDGLHQVQGSVDTTVWDMATATASVAWEDVCWAQSLGLFVAVGQNAVMTSPDGVAWTARTPATSTGAGRWRSVCWSPSLSLLVAVNDDFVVGSNVTAVMTSPDGINWTIRTLASVVNTRSVCWSPTLNLFVAAGVTISRITTSPDGINWTRTAALTGTFQTFGVCWTGAPLNLFVGVPVHASTQVGKISSNGTAWSSITVPAGVTDNYIGVCSNGSVIVAVGDGCIARSTDGTNWFSQTAPEMNTFSRVCWSASLSLFIAVASSGTHRVMTSPDGITWTMITAAEQNTWAGIATKS